MLDIVPSLPIHEALHVLLECDNITNTEHKTLSTGMLTAVRTFGDLLEVLRTRDILNMPGVGDKLYQKLCDTLLDKSFCAGIVLVGDVGSELVSLPLDGEIIPLRD